MKNMPFTLLISGMQKLRNAASGDDLPNPRLASFKLNEDRDNPHHMNTLMLMQWGQFLDHDLSHTAISKISDDPSGQYTCSFLIFLLRI